MRKIWNGISLILSLLLGVIFYFQFDFEDILWNKYVPAVISAEQMTWDVRTDFTGQKAGEGVLSLTTGAEWEASLCGVDYVTVVPVAIEKTNVYEQERGMNYAPYYIIELEDGTCLLAQMNQGLAAKIKQGQMIELPLGRKMEVPARTQSLLKPICDSRHIDTNYVLYTINDAWKTEHVNIIFLGKITASLLVALIWAVVLQLIMERIPNAKGRVQEEKKVQPSEE